MLGKLIKHEWKNIYKIGCIIVLVIAAVTAIGCIMLHIPAMTDLFSEENNIDDFQAVMWSIMGVISMMLYIFMLLGATYGMYVFLGVRFYQSMYSKQGYLTHTLPVTAHQLLVSKLLVSGIWTMIITIAVFVSMFALVISLLNGIFASVIDLEGFDSIWEVMGMIIEETGEEFAAQGLNLTHYTITMILMLVVGPFSGLMTLFGCLTLGQLSKKMKLFMGILAYLGVMLLNMIIGMVIQLISTINYSISIVSDGTVTNMNGSYDASLIVTTAMAVILYISSHYILTKKLNME